MKYVVLMEGQEEDCPARNMRNKGKNTEEESVDIITRGEMLKKGIVKPKTDAPHTPKTPRMNKTPKKVKKRSNKEPKPVPNTKNIHPFFSSPQSASSQDLMTMWSAPR